MAFTGSVPGMAASNSATLQLTAPAKSVGAPENNLELLKICACTSKPITLFQSLLKQHQINQTKQF